MSNMTQALTQAAVMTFEELAFLLPDPELNDVQRAAGHEARVTLEFSGAFNGQLVVRLYGGLLPCVAANMLGQMSPPDERTQQDALGELANVLCGNALPCIADKKEVFQLSAPRVERYSGSPWPPPSSPAAARTALGLESGRAEVELFIQQPLSAD